MITPKIKVRNALILFAVTRAMSALVAPNSGPSQQPLQRRRKFKMRPDRILRGRKSDVRAKMNRAVKEDDERSIAQLLQEMGSLGWVIACKVRNDFKSEGRKIEGASRNVEDLARGASAKFIDIVSNALKG